MIRWAPNLQVVSCVSVAVFFCYYAWDWMSTLDLKGAKRPTTALASLVALFFYVAVASWIWHADLDFSGTSGWEAWVAIALCFGGLVCYRYFTFRRFKSG